VGEGDAGSAPPQRLPPALEAYLATLDERARRSSPSLFWERRLAELGGPAVAREDLAGVVAAGSYGFEELPEGAAPPDEQPAFADALARAGEIRRLAKRLTARGFDVSKDDWEHTRALDFLRTAGVLDDYRAFLRPLRVRSTMSVARHWYYATRIARLAREHLPARPLDVLEIGGGAGNLAYVLWRMGLVGSYTMVDLPEMLAHAAFTVQRHLPDVEMVFGERARPGGAGFLAAEEVGGLPADAFDVCLNLNSFMEMDEAQVDAYLGVVARTGRPGALFFNVNRRQRALPQRDGSTWDNNPLLYPYRPDRVLAWEEDDFQTATRSTAGDLPSLAVARAALLGG